MPTGMTQRPGLQKLLEALPFSKIVSGHEKPAQWGPTTLLSNPHFGKITNDISIVHSNLCISRASTQVLFSLKLYHTGGQMNMFL